jgi:hypothetical protein
MDSWREPKDCGCRTKAVVQHPGCRQNGTWIITLKIATFAGVSQLIVGGSVLA